MPYSSISTASFTTLLCPRNTFLDKEKKKLVSKKMLDCFGIQVKHIAIYQLDVDEGYKIAPLQVCAAVVLSISSSSEQVGRLWGGGGVMCVYIVS